MKARAVCIFLIVIVVMSQGIVGVSAQEPAPASYSVNLNRVGHIYQKWNNCGPATLTMGLSFYGFPIADRNAQDSAARYLKPNIEDQNVSPWQLVDYVNQKINPDLGLRAIYRAGGDLDTLKRLIAADIPVIIEKGYEPARNGEALGWMGHYLLLVGYDDNEGHFITYDSYAGPGLRESYEYVSRYWQQFNNLFVVVYPAAQEADVQTILGEAWDANAAWQNAVRTAQENAAAAPDDFWSWFNLGEALNYLGEYDMATLAFRQALDTNRMPFRTLWYMHGAFEAFYRTGQFKTVDELVRVITVNTPYIEEAYYYRGLIYAAQDRTAEALALFDQVLRFNPNFYPAAEARMAIENNTFVGPVQTDAG